MMTHPSKNEWVIHQKPFNTESLHEKSTLTALVHTADRFPKEQLFYTVPSAHCVENVNRITTIIR